MSGEGSLDARWMAESIGLASLGEGCTRPNPLVGCVVLRDGEPVGSGWHERAGGPHAEVVALEEAGERARGATVYVNLEPCAHHGRTAPCTDMLIERGVARVVAAVQDPNPQVDGRGFDRLRRAGIEVEVGVLAAEASRLNAPFLHWQRHGRPLLTLKAAVSLDGRLSAREGVSRWITGPDARRVAHRLRLRHDAVMVGGRTVRLDDPRLTVRLPVECLPPLRVVVSASLDLPADAALLDEAGERPVLFTSRRGAAARGSVFADRARIEIVDEGPEGLDLTRVVARLGALGVQSVLVEGGGILHASLMRAGLADELALFGAPRLIGAEGATDWIPGPAAAEPASSWRVAVAGRARLGRDLFCHGALIAPGEPG